jgi:hypothetical protein
VQHRTKHSQSKDGLKDYLHWQSWLAKPAEILHHHVRFHAIVLFIVANFSSTAWVGSFLFNGFFWFQRV